MVSINRMKFKKKKKKEIITTPFNPFFFILKIVKSFEILFKHSE